MGMLIFTLLAALVLHPAQSDSVDGNGAAAAGAAAENENDETNDLENEYIRDAHVGKNDEHVQKLRIIGDNAAGVKVKTSGNEYIHKTFEGTVQNKLIDIRTFQPFACLSMCVLEIASVVHVGLAEWSRERGSGKQHDCKCCVGLDRLEAH